ncbi:hypothetical protein CCHR01_19605 [Colletotrichum chrysophilum]|uniref:Uncharacterized protein n=1 Tax=Colletotrichum chrysophilum TaxID=1836956 RepID=A0AAD8ZYP4_9PEZI|nr:hypothetical protein CCHR01_19605 [Colletotrichum chrysophilum]
MPQRKLQISQTPPPQLDCCLFCPSRPHAAVYDAAAATSPTSIRRCTP